MAGYFDDICFAGGEAMPNCRVTVDARFADSYSLEFIESGRLSFGIDSGAPTVIDHAAAFWHHPRHRYQYGPVDACGWHHHWLLMRGSRARRIVETALMPLAAEGYVSVSDAPMFGAAFRRLLGLVAGRDPRRHAEAVARLELLVATLICQADVDAPMSTHRPGVADVAAAIRTRPWQDVDFHAEARRLRLSYSHFRRLFRRELGRAPHDYLLTERMQWAAHRLRSQDGQIKAIACAAGYADAAQFCKLFRRRIGLSPSQYRAAVPRGKRREN